MLAPTSARHIEVSTRMGMRDELNRDILFIVGSPLDYSALAEFFRYQINVTTAGFCAERFTTSEGSGAMLDQRR
jgi:hypothetical protein